MFKSSLASDYLMTCAEFASRQAKVLLDTSSKLRLEHPLQAALNLPREDEGEGEGEGEGSDFLVRFHGGKVR